MSNLIIVIEDSKPIRKLFCTLLEKSGYQTKDFEDAKSSIQWLNENTGSKGIIMDILLPDMNGTELLKKVKETAHKDTPVIAITGFAASNDREKYLNMGFDHYMSKPINTSTFIEEIKTVFE